MPGESQDCQGDLLLTCNDGSPVPFAAIEKTSKSALNELRVKCADICSVNDNANTITFNYTGIILVEGLPIIIFPKNFHEHTQHVHSLTDCTLQNEIRLLMRVLRKYKSTSYCDREEEQYLFGESGAFSHLIEICMQLIEDYALNGIIARHYRRESVNSTGLTLWNKTISKVAPVFSHRAPVYLQSIVQKKSDRNDHIVTAIHMYAVTQACLKWGWLCNGKVHQDHVMPHLPVSLSDAIRILEHELREVYVHREICTIHNIIYFLSEARANTKSPIKLFGTKKYEKVWEAICGYIFDNRYEQLSSFLPQPRWALDEGRLSDSQQPCQIPDILFTPANSRILYILDAKYYNYTRKVPGWRDIVKQYYYLQTITGDNRPEGLMKRMDVSHCENAFIFPLFDETDTVRIRHVARIAVDGCDLLGHIDAFGINQNKAMKAYLQPGDSQFANIVKCEFLSYFAKGATP